MNKPMVDAAVLETVRAFLQTQSTLALATQGAGGQPQVAALFYVADEALNLYWLSAAQVRHSLNLEADGRAAATIYPAVWGWEAIAGVQAEGRARVIQDAVERNAIMRLYRAKFDLPPAFDSTIASSGLYQLQPSWIRWIDNRVRFGHKTEWRPGE